jgi:hypothetical protein
VFETLKIIYIYPGSADAFYFRGGNTAEYAKYENSTSRVSIVVAIQFHFRTILIDLVSAFT